MKFVFKVCIFILFQSTNIIAQKIYFPPTSQLSNVWDTINPKTLGWCENKIQPFYDYLESANSKAIIVLKDGKIVLENYFGTFTRDSFWYWASAGKSVTSMLIGKAQEDGKLSILDPTSKYLGTGWTNCTALQESKITIKHQITMTTGLDDGVADNHCITPNCLIYKADAGARWAYHNAPYTLLEKVIENASGQTINAFTNEKLKSSTGMNGIWTTVDGDNVFFSKARSMARYGILAQNKFNWNGLPILKDTAYINRMTTSSQNLNNSYGYLWWLNGKKDYMVPGLQIVFKGSYAPDAPSDMFAALGKNGQILSISPSKGIVVLRMGNEPGSSIVDVPTMFCNQIWQYLNEIMCSTTSITDANELKENVIIRFLPIEQRIDIQADEEEIYQLNIFDINGKLISNNQCKGAFSLDGSNFENGIYFIRCRTKDQKLFTSRIIIHKI